MILKRVKAWSGEIIIIKSNNMWSLEQESKTSRTSTEWLFCNLFQAGKLEDPDCDVRPKSDANDLGLHVLLVQRRHVNASDFVLQGGVAAQNQLFVFNLKTKSINSFTSR